MVLTAIEKGKMELRITGGPSGGEQTIARVLGKDASMEWNMIHAPGTVTWMNWGLGRGRLTA